MLYAFKGGSDDGGGPVGALVADAAGNLYGVTESHGVSSCQFGCGVVFKLAPDGTESVLKFFSAFNGGNHPMAGLSIDGAGNLYGTTQMGGGGGGCGGPGCGTVFKIAPDGTQTILHAFADNASDGAVPSGGVVMDRDGDLFGTTTFGGSHGFGAAYRIASDGDFAVLYSFAGGQDGQNPTGDLILDAKGNLYGTTQVGGGTGCGGQGCGTAFKLSPDGTEKVLHRFKPADGSMPSGSLLMSANGHLYGAARLGPGGKRHGVVFGIAP